mgnify:CR=1 FL=1
METDILQLSLREITTKYPASISVLNNYQIDFYCNGKDILSKSIENYSIKENEFMEKLNSSINSENQYYPIDVGLWPLDLMADYVEKTHHRFTEDILQKIKTTFQDYLEINRTAELEELYEYAIALSKELGGHMKKEELVLFPFIRKMVNRRGELARPHFSTVENPIAMMEHEHIVASDLVQKIRKITDNYSTDDIVDTKYIYLLSLLKDLDNDLIYHLHIENNILFPKSVEMEKRTSFEE